ncbi:fibrous sheath-interacting protein 1 [Narcine bancroftii]|uniref:fibrous sheath-interacting protein 1 n=1 Tax=Narcine bancroftii TaxID=1343680 RepID=UPI003831D696
MDIVRGQFDEINRCATGFRTRPGSRVASGPSPDRRGRSVHCSGAMMVLTPEPNLNQERLESLESKFNPADSSTSSYFDNLDSELESFSEQDRMNTVTDKVDPGGQHETLSLSREQTKSNILEVQISDKSGILHGRTDSEENSEDHLPIQDQTKSLKIESDNYKEEDFTDSAEDSQLEDAIAKMKTLDKILVMKEEKERQVKKQGEELRKKLWEELENRKSEGMVEYPEVAENEMRFLALTPGGNGEELTVPSIFHTQLPIVHYEMKTNEQDQGYQDCAEEVKLPSAACSKNVQKETSSRVAPQNKIKDFIKKNIELAKEAKNPVLLTDDEKRRLAELLKNIDVEISNNDDASMPWAVTVAERDGYTSEPMDQQQLAEVDAKLQVYLLTEDIPMIISSRSSEQTWNYQSSMDSFSEIGPGEEVLVQLRDEREQHLRMGEIERQLKCLETSVEFKDLWNIVFLGNIDMSDGMVDLPKDKLTSLLDDCIRCQSSGRIFENKVLDADCDISSSWCSPQSQAMTEFNIPWLPDSVISQLLEDAYRSGLSPASGRVQEGSSNQLDTDAESEDPNYYRNKALANISRLAVSTVDDDKPNGEVEKWMVNNEVPYLTRALEITQRKKFTFHNDSNLQWSTHQQLQTNNSIPTIPLLSHIDDENATEVDENAADNEPTVTKIIDREPQAKYFPY